MFPAAFEKGITEARTQLLTMPDNPEALFTFTEHNLGSLESHAFASHNNAGVERLRCQTHNTRSSVIAEELSARLSASALSVPTDCVCGGAL